MGEDGVDGGAGAVCRADRRDGGVRGMMNDLPRCSVTVSGKIGGVR
jgi:hypothetical protein